MRLSNGELVPLPSEIRSALAKAGVPVPVREAVGLYMDAAEMGKLHQACVLAEAAFEAAHEAARPDDDAGHESYLARSTALWDAIDCSQDALFASLDTLPNFQREGYGEIREPGKAPVLAGT